MLLGVGRILVAAAGAVVLVVVAVFVVRSVWWDPNTGTTSSTTVPSTTRTGTSDSEATTSENPVPTDTRDTESSESGGSTSESSTDDPVPFTDATEKVRRLVGTVAVDVDLPQVAGGDPSVTAAFNDEMTKTLNAQADTVVGGKLEGRPGTGVRIGKQVLSGVLRTSAVDITKATSKPLVGTVVVDAESGSVITLSSLFDDVSAGLALLVDETKKLGPSSAAGSSFDTTRVEPTEEMFRHWTAESAGMHVFFDQGAVAPAAAGIVDVTVPWESLGGAMKSGVAAIVAS